MQAGAAQWADLLKQFVAVAKMVGCFVGTVPDNSQDSLKQALRMGLQAFEKVGEGCSVEGNAFLSNKQLLT